MVALPLTFLDLPATPPPGITVDAHAAITALLCQTFTAVQSDLNDGFERTCAKIVLTTPRFIERVEDSGYDVSVYPEPSSEAYPIASWTVADLLEAPTGDTTATFVSGAGFAPLRWHAKVEDAIHAWLTTALASIVGDEDRVFELNLTDAYDTPRLVAMWLEAQGPRPLTPMVERWGADVREDAQIAAVEAVRRRDEAAARAKDDQQRAHRVHVLLDTLHGAPLPSFTMPERSMLEALLRRATDHGVTAADVRAYATYTTRLSNRLRRHIVAWAEVQMPSDGSPADR